MATTARRHEVPSPLTLLLIQSGGGVLSLLTIATLPRFAQVSGQLYFALVAGAVFNVLLSVALLLGYLQDWRYYRNTVGRLREVGLVRAILVYDTVMLGSLVMLTGGAETSVFGPQFAAILPVAMLIRDLPAWKWTHAGLFFLMFLMGLVVPVASFEYIQDRPERQLWFLVFFSLFTLFPAAYSIQSEQRQPFDQSPRAASRG